jgi:hypothetical protein
MIRIFLYYLLLLTVVSLAFRRGDRETRIAACICVAASVLSALLMTFHTQVAAGVAVVDLAVLGLFVALALRTERFWPLWIAGLQLTTVLGHLLRLLEPGLVNIVYAAAMRFWAYPILLILIVAAIRSERYRRPEPLPAA